MDSWIDYDDGKIDYQHRYIDDDEIENKHG